MLRALIAGIVALLLIVLLVGYLLLSAPIGEEGKEYSVLVRPSDNARDLKEKLIESGLSLRPRVYSLLMVISSTDTKIQPGRYTFDGRLSHYNLVKLFEAGDVATSKVTIPEGLTVERTVPILVRGVPTDSMELTRLLSDSSYFASFGIAAPDFEGFLFPTTYSFYSDDLPRNVIRQMIGMFEAIYVDSLRVRARELGMTTNEVITLASMIEAEATDGAERELISSVFHNRLRIGMKLQCDPTVIYGLGGLDRPLWRRDLDHDSPYNTYLHYGLPPGPICSPGLASIEAALYPVESKYLYFVADGEGGHIFTRSLIEHNRAIEEVKRRKRQRG